MGTITIVVDGWIFLIIVILTVASLTCDVIERIQEIRFNWYRRRYHKRVEKES